MCRISFIQKPWQKLLEALLVSSVSCVMAFAMIFWLDDCEPLRVSNDANETLPLQVRDTRIIFVTLLLDVLQKRRVQHCRSIVPALAGRDG
jgi:hypothetical protein